MLTDELQHHVKVLGVLCPPLRQTHRKHGGIRLRVIRVLRVDLRVVVIVLLLRTTDNK